MDDDAIEQAVQREVDEFHCPNCGEINRIHFLSTAPYDGHTAKCDACDHKWNPPPPWAQPPKTYKSQSARDAQARGYGKKDYWDYLDEHAQELYDKFMAEGDQAMAESMLTRSLSESLMGNEGD